MLLLIFSTLSGHASSCNGRRSKSTSPALIAFQDEKQLVSENTDKEEQDEKYGFVRVLKLIYCELLKFSLPLFLSYLCFEFTRSGLISRIWNGQKNAKHKVIYTEFVLAFRMGNLIGRSSTNVVVIEALDILPALIAYNMVIFGTIYWSHLFGYFVYNKVGHWLVYLFMAIPIGISYGSVSSNVVNGIRSNISDKRTREMALGNIKQVQSYGQICGILSTYFLR